MKSDKSDIIDAEAPLKPCILCATRWSEREHAFNRMRAFCLEYDDLEHVEQRSLAD